MADFAHKPTLTGEKVVLRRFAADDVDPLAAILTDAEALKYTGSTGLTVDKAELRSLYATRASRADRLDLAVVDRASGEFVGEVVLNEWDRQNRSCAFRTVLGPNGRDRGLGTEATTLIVGYGFEQLGLHRISLFVYAFNARARRVYEKVGFVAEGVERERLRQEGAWFDAIRMSILDHEWSARRRR